MAHIHVLAIKSILGSFAGLRRKRAETYDDPRNLPAHELLLALAKQDALALPRELVAALDPYTGPAFADTVGTVAKEIGFRSWPADLKSVIREVLARLQAVPSADGASLAAVLPQGGAR